MTYGSVSPKYQVVIPKEVRESLKLKPGQRLMIIAKGNVIHMIPEIPLNELKGRYRGMDASVPRDDEEERCP